MNPPPHIRPPCPLLPEAVEPMSYRDLNRLKDGPAPEFYETALRYGHCLWRRGLAGRALLAVSRALYAEVAAAEPVLRRYPLPYAAIGWIVREQPRDAFPGNPRVSFQHQATRLRGERQGVRRARAWAAWAVVRNARPSLPPDAAQNLREPDTAAIAAGLRAPGIRGEAEVWREALARFADAGGPT